MTSPSLSNLYIGIDVGTSACRACAINDRREIVAQSRKELAAAETRESLVEQDPGIWWQAMCSALDLLCRQLPTHNVQRIAIDGTSTTLLLCGTNGAPLTPGLMYNDTRSTREAERIAAIAPADAAVHGPGASLAKLLFLLQQTDSRDCRALHQADWLSGKLLAKFDSSDENNALKLGYDVNNRCWPDWMTSLQLPAGVLPVVVPPGTPLGNINPDLASRWNFPAGLEIAAGTTDSTAGFIATGASQTGSAVTSLGSTLVIKVLSDLPVNAARYGVYSHRLGSRWLVGGASNAGGSVLRRHFSAGEIQRYTNMLKPEQPTGLNYYPLPGTGERFPVSDPQLKPRMEPRPASDAVFFQAILEGLADIEQRGYHLLNELGAPYPERIITVGGGAQNPGWIDMRARRLGVPVSVADRREAAYGAALLARGLEFG